MKYVSSLLFVVLLAVTECLSQQSGRPGDRKPAVAGTFYESEPEALLKTLGELFSQAAEEDTTGPVRALIAPHAGYIYSGTVAASAYDQLEKGRKFRRVFILGPSHHLAFDGASVYDRGDYETPLGTVKVDVDLAKKLIRDHAVFSCREEAHRDEHSLEVQLPFLQYKLGKDFMIIPILLGSHDVAECRSVAAALMPYFTDENLFIVSSDFSHYPAYEDACKADAATAGAITSNSVVEFATTVNDVMARKIPNLLTCMCGWPAVMTLLFMTQEDPEMQVRLIRYANSGDSGYGDSSRVVGYCAISFVSPAGHPEKTDPEEKMAKEGFILSEADRQELLSISRETLASWIGKRTIPGIDTAAIPAVLKTPAGAFVTLNKEGKLRGCVGRFKPDGPLYKVVQEMTISSATKDYRFTPVTSSELGKIRIEISVLTPLVRIYDIDDIELGRNGIYIRKGYQSGTFLPQVAERTGWTREEFVSHCAHDKAGLGWDGWKDAELYTYEAYVFEEQ